MEVNWGKHQLSRYQVDAERVVKRLRKRKPSRALIDRIFALFTTYLDARQQGEFESTLDVAMLTLIQELYGYVQPGEELSQLSYLCSEALKIAERLPNLPLRANAYFQLALVKNEQGDVKAAQALYEHICHSEQLANMSTYEQATALFQLGVCYVNQGHHAKATKELKRSIALASAHAYPYTKAYALNQLGNIAMSQADFAQAEQHYRETLAILEEHSPEKHLACIAYNSLGRLLRVQQEFEQAIPLLEKSRFLWQQRQEEGGIAKNAVELALAYIGENRVDEAENLLNETLETHKQNRHQRGIALCHYAFGQIEQKRGNREAAIAQWEQALAIYQDLSIPLQEFQLLSVLLPNLFLAGRFRDFFICVVYLIRHLLRQRLGLWEMVKLIKLGVKHMIGMLR